MVTKVLFLTMLLTGSALRPAKAQEEHDEEQAPPPTLQELRKSATKRYASKPARFQARYESATRPALGASMAPAVITSRSGDFEVHAPQRFRIRSEVVYGPFVRKFLTQSQNEKVITKLSIFDKSGESELHKEDIYRVVLAKHLQVVSSYKLAALILCYVADPPRFLSLAAERYPGLAVVETSKHGWTLETTLKEASIPPAERIAKPHTIRLVLGPDFIVRELSVLQRDGGVYVSHKLTNVRPLPEKHDPFPAIVIPENANIRTLRPPAEKKR